MKSQTKRKFSFGLNIGTSSILVIFVLLCLTFFAALTLISANADLKLTDKILNRNTAYYDACNEAQLSLAALDVSLKEAYLSTENEMQYFEITKNTRCYLFSVSETQSLKVEVEILYPENDGDTFYRITCWQVISAS